MLIVGDKERENGHVSVRHRAKGDIGVMPQKEFLEKLRAIVDSKSTE
jgi:threonyl-tRNA synthetase